MKNPRKPYVAPGRPEVVAVLADAASTSYSALYGDGPSYSSTPS